MNRIFDPGPKTYSHLLDRLDRQIDLKYLDHSTALDFQLKSAKPVSEENEQGVLFVAPILVEAAPKKKRSSRPNCWRSRHSEAPRS